MGEEHGGVQVKQWVSDSVIYRHSMVAKVQILFALLYFSAVLGLLCCMWLPLGAEPGLLTAAASPVGGRGLYGMRASAVPACGLSSCSAWA